MTAFTCPICGATCPTLYDFLTCHPRKLRAMTALMETERFSGARLATLYHGDSPLALYVAALETLGPQDESEAADVAA